MKSTVVEIPFNEWSRKRLQAGVKCATTRRFPYGKPGDRFQAVGRWWVLTDVRRIRLEEVAERYYKEEGAESPEEFIEVWKSIHPRAGWTPKRWVWIHFFQPAPTLLGMEGNVRGSVDTSQDEGVRP